LIKCATDTLDVINEVGVLNLRENRKVNLVGQEQIVQFAHQSQQEVMVYVRALHGQVNV